MSATQARLFFALWPDPAVQAALADIGRDLQRRLGGKLTRRESIHLTLAFLGDIAPEKMSNVEAVAAGTAFEAFSFALDTVGCWKHNGIAWIRPSVTPQPMLQLAHSLASALVDAGFQVDGRPYAAHVTVLRKARCKPLDLAIAPVHWQAREFVLVRSELSAEGSRYSVVGRWPQPHD